jgi:hypothetical protein
MTELEIEGAEVCYGTDILDWYARVLSDFYLNFILVLFILCCLYFMIFRINCKGDDQRDRIEAKGYRRRHEAQGMACLRILHFRLRGTHTEVVTVNDRVRFVELLLWKLESMGVDNVSAEYATLFSLLIFVCLFFIILIFFLFVYLVLFWKLVILISLHLLNP